MTRTEARKLTEAGNRAGGFTYSLSAHAFAGASGFVVSLPGHERKVGSLSARTLRRYVAANRETLSERGTHLGAWRNGSTWYLDVSVITSDRAMAETMAKLNAQLAIYDLSRGAEITL